MVEIKSDRMMRESDFNHFWRCPICGTRNFGLGCSNCGYSKSVGFNIWKEKSRKMFHCKREGEMNDR